VFPGRYSLLQHYPQSDYTAPKWDQRFMRTQLLRVIKWVLLVLGGLILVLSIVYRDLVIYGFRQAKGQLTIVWKAKPVVVYLNDPAFPDSLKAKLRLVEEVRQFAIDSLGLKDTRNYKTLYDQKGKEIMWVVTACEPYQLKEKEWVFPVLGAVPYKGFFDRELALRERKSLENQGWDVNVRNPGGWSTLGWFTDPILSGMLARTEGDLASLIIHEMVHATIFVKDSVDFNENLASFIGDRGAEQFLTSKFGKQSDEYLRYIREERDFIRYVDHILRGGDYLDSLYRGIASKQVEEKLRLKEEAIRHIMRSLDTLSLPYLGHIAARNQNTLPNNAYFMSFRRYQWKQEDLWNEWQQGFGGDLKAYIEELTRRFPFL
jgi:predicted aminopeptidase